MLADGAQRAATGRDPAGAIDGLTPVLVAEEAEVNELVRTARAGVAVLSLHLRNARQEATRAAGEGGGWDRQAATAFLATALDEHRRARRIEMAEELERARGEAARLVLSTRTEAAARIAAAGEEILDVLLAGTGPEVEGSDDAVEPTLRIVGDEPAPEAASAVPEPTWPVAEVSAPMVAEVSAPVVAEVSAPVVVPDGGPAVVVPDVGSAVAVPLSAVPVAGPDLHTAARVQVAPAVAAAVADPAPAPPAPAAAPLVRDSRMARFLYVDVLLPMIAVLVVLVVLLAWVG